jgi:hypothetical protein
MSTRPTLSGDWCEEAGKGPTRLLVVRAQEVHGGEGELILLRVGELLVVHEELGLLAHLVRDVEEQPVAERVVGPLEGFL